MEDIKINYDSHTRKALKGLKKKELRKEKKLKKDQNILFIKKDQIKKEKELKKEKYNFLKLTSETLYFPLALRPTKQILLNGKSIPFNKIIIFENSKQNLYFDYFDSSDNNVDLLFEKNKTIFIFLINSYLRLSTFFMAGFKNKLDRNQVFLLILKEYLYINYILNLLQKHNKIKSNLIQKNFRRCDLIVSKDFFFLITRVFFTCLKLLNFSEEDFKLNRNQERKLEESSFKVLIEKNYLSLYKEKKEFLIISYIKFQEEKNKKKLKKK